MSRVAKKPVPLPQGVTATLAPDVVTIKGAKGTLSVPLKSGVSVTQGDKQLQVAYTDAAGARVRLRFVADNWRIDEVRVAGAITRPEYTTLAVDSVIVPTPASVSSCW